MSFDVAKAKRLNAGYARTLPFRVSGLAADSTEFANAVFQFQQSVPDIKADGIFGPATCSAMNSLRTPATTGLWSIVTCGPAAGPAASPAVPARPPAARQQVAPVSPQAPSGMPSYRPAPSTGVSKAAMIGAAAAALGAVYFLWQGLKPAPMRVAA